MKDINTFVREIYHQANTKISVFNLHASEDDEIVLLGWSDAALANRVDLSSTGGYIIGFAHKKMLEKGEAGPIYKSCELEHSQAEEDLPLQSWS